MRNRQTCRTIHVERFFTFGDVIYSTLLGVNGKNKAMQTQCIQYGTLNAVRYNTCSKVHYIQYGTLHAVRYITSSMVHYMQSGTLHPVSGTLHAVRCITCSTVQYMQYGTTGHDVLHTHIPLYPSPCASQCFVEYTIHYTIHCDDPRPEEYQSNSQSILPVYY